MSNSNINNRWCGCGRLLNEGETLCPACTNDRNSQYKSLAIALTPIILRGIHLLIKAKK